MKKSIIWSLALLLLFTGCSKKKDADSSTQGNATPDTSVVEPEQSSQNEDQEPAPTPMPVEEETEIELQPGESDAGL